MFYTIFKFMSRKTAQYLYTHSQECYNILFSVSVTGSINAGISLEFFFMMEQVTEVADVRRTRAKGPSNLGGSGGMPPRKFLESKRNFLQSEAS